MMYCIYIIFRAYDIWLISIFVIYSGFELAFESNSLIYTFIMHILLCTWFCGEMSPDKRAKKNTSPNAIRLQYSYCFYAVCVLLENIFLHDSSWHLIWSMLYAVSSRIISHTSIHYIYGSTVFRTSGFVTIVICRVNVRWTALQVFPQLYNGMNFYMLVENCWLA